MKNIFNKTISGSLLVLLTLSVAACSGNSKKETQDEDTQTTAQSLDANKTANGKLNINTATEEAFRTIPKVGDKMVHEFDEYRPYVSIREFRQEIGKYVDEDQVAAYEDYIYVPIHRNDSDPQTLMQIPGLDDDETQELIAGRPYTSDQAFFDALTSFISDEELATAKTYMKAE